MHRFIQESMMENVNWLNFVGDCHGFQIQARVSYCSDSVNVMKASWLKSMDLHLVLGYTIHPTLTGLNTVQHFLPLYLV